MITYGEKLLRGFEHLVAQASLVGTGTFLEPNQFGWVSLLEANWHTIRQELDQVLQDWAQLPNFQDLSPDQAGITQDDRWKTYFFYFYGIKAEVNCDRCPRTTGLIEQVPGMQTAFFSILAPHKQIPPHRGPYNGVLRYHLGLKVPEPREQCRIRVGNEIRHWQEGHSLVFDDSWEHQVWNDTDGIRVILFLDVERPLRFPVSWLNQGVIRLIAGSPYIQDIVDNQRQWDQRMSRTTSN